MSGFRKHTKGTIAVAVAVGAMSIAWGAQKISPPVIKHEPILLGVRGQSLTVRASVSGADSAVRNVFLHYTVSQDSAPFKLTMMNVGGDAYLVTIPGTLLGSAAQVSYYIEAVDERDTSAETSWYKVDMRLPRSGDEPVAVSQQTQPGKEPVPKKKSWVKPALYTGGALALIGGGIWAAGSGGSGGDADTGETPDVAGSYVGSVTTCLVFGSEPQVCETRAMRILVTSEGVVNSDTLLDGVYMEGRLSGTSFSLSSAVNNTNGVGEIRYDGTILDGRITGSISGNQTRGDGASGVYSGTFYAVRQ